MTAKLIKRKCRIGGKKKTKSHMVLITMGAVDPRSLRKRRRRFHKQSINQSGKAVIITCDFSIIIRMATSGSRRVRRAAERRRAETRSCCGGRRVEGRDAKLRRAERRPRKSQIEGDERTNDRRRRCEMNGRLASRASFREQPSRHAHVRASSKAKCGACTYTQ